MKKTILITRPFYDHETAVLFHLSGKLIKKLKEIGEYKILDAEKGKAVRKIFEDFLQKQDPRLIILNGHGSLDAVLGQEEIILDKENVNLLKGKIIYSVACDSTECLGPLAVENGADAYIGYGAKFMIVYTHSKTATPQKDKSITPFEEMYVWMCYSLASGFCIQDCVDKTKECIRGLIRQYGVSEIRDKYGDAALIRFALHWNYHFLKYYGNGEARV